MRVCLDAPSGAVAFVRAGGRRSRAAAIGGAVLGLALASGQAALAQGSPTPASAPATAAETDAMKSLGQQLAGPELKPTLPATPERVKLMRQYMAEANVAGVAKAMSATAYAQAKTQVEAGVKALPAQRQALIMAAFAKAFDAAQDRREQKVLDRMADYYATRMTDAELKGVVDYYATPLGTKVLHGGQGMTPEDRQAFGRYLLDHPEMMKFTKINFDYIKSVQASQSAVNLAFTSDVRASFCKNLAADHLQAPACSAAGHAGRPGA